MNSETIYFCAASNLKFRSIKKWSLYVTYVWVIGLNTFRWTLTTIIGVASWKEIIDSNVTSCWQPWLASPQIFLVVCTRSFEWISWDRVFTGKFTANIVIGWMPRRTRWNAGVHWQPEWLSINSVLGWIKSRACTPDRAAKASPTDWYLKKRSDWWVGMPMLKQ